MNVENLRAVGSIPPDIWELLQVGGAGNPNVHVRDLGNVPKDWEDSGRVPTKGCPPSGEDSSREVYGGRWVYPLLEKAIIVVGLEEVDTCILRRQNIITQYIATRPILEIYLAEERRMGAWVEMI